MKPKRDYDPACAILAEHFLLCEPVEDDDAIASLASSIQNTVELWYVLNRKHADADHEPEATPG